MRLMAHDASLLPIVERDLQTSARTAERLKKAKRSDLQLSRYDSSDDSDEETGALTRTWGLVARTALAFALVCTVLFQSAAPPLGRPSPAYRRACGGRAGAGAEPAVRWRESAPAFGETAAVVMPEPVDRSDELARARRGGAADLAELAPAHRLTLEQRFGDAATVDVEVAVADEVARGAGGDDDSVFIAALWNARILNLVGRLIDDVLEADDLATDERTISAIATRAYQKTLAKHHNWVLRPAAKALLKMTPDRASLLRDRFGYEADEWNTRARADFADFSGALQACLRRLAAVYAPYDEEI
ncbi:hypothetical protein JL721_11996 [Aureococcus anophagefferens]|nr:hypothetical protein JL721_11996 [Aureococcus anophagefferens]